MGLAVEAVGGARRCQARGSATVVSLMASQDGVPQYVP